MVFDPQRTRISRLKSCSITMDGYDYANMSVPSRALLAKTAFVHINYSP